MALKSLDKGWKTWSTQATELQLLQVDYENWKKQGQCFFKMDEAAIATVQDELAKDIYELSASHREEITKLMEEYDDQHMATTVQFDAYEEERHQQIGELGESGDNEPTQEEAT